jgi:hypothetical protein
LHFGKALKTKLQIDSNLSTAFHPQTDGLTECSNQWIEQYLQLVIGAKQNDWAHWLSLAAAIHNNKQNAILGLVPNQVLWGHDV